MRTSKKMHDLSTLAGRIGFIVDQAGSQKGLSERSGVALRTVSAYANGKDSVTSKVIHALADAAAVDPDWLMTGIGEPDGSNRSFLKMSAAMVRTPEVGRQENAAFGRGIRMMAAEKGLASTHAAAEVPLVGVAAGSAVSAMHLTGAIAGWVGCPLTLNHIPALYALQVVNNSMAPDYPHGTIVFVDPHGAIAENDIVIVQQQLGSLQKVECFIKQFVARDDAGLQLVQRAGNAGTTIANTYVKAVHKVVGAA